MFLLSKEQRLALKRVYDRDHTVGQSYLQYRRELVKNRHIHQGWDCLMVFWAGMWLGIETSGYCHS